MIQRTDGSSAMIRAESIADEQRRQQTLTEIWQSWRTRDGVAATRWLREEAGISPASRAVIESLEAASASGSP